MPPERLHTLTRILETLAASSIPLLRGIEIEAQEADYREMRVFLTRLGQNLAAGHSLEKSLSASDRSIPYFYTTLVAIGESSGRLKEILGTLSAYIKKNIQVRRDLVSAVSYPLMLTGVATLTMFFISSMVLPNMLALYKGFGKQPPQLTLWVIGGMAFVQDHVLGILLAVALIVSGVLLSLKSSWWRGAYTTVGLRIPYLGKWISDFFFYRFLKICSIQIDGGQTVVRALETLTKLYEPNKRLSDYIALAGQRVSQGVPLSRALSDRRLHASRAVQYIRLGEEAGKLSAYLAEAAQFYEERITYRLVVLKELLQPALLVVIGLGIGFLLVSLFLPIFQAVTLVGGKP